MAKKKSVEKKPREMTRRQLSQHKRQQRRQRIIFIGGITIIAAVVLIVLVGWIVGEYLPMHRTVLKINDVKFDTRYLIDSLKLYGANEEPEKFEGLGTTVIQRMVENEIILQAAEKLGITVSVEEIREEMAGLDGSMTDAYIDVIRAQRARARIKDEYIPALVPVSDDQVDIYAMLVESNSLALELRDRLMAGDNFTALAEQYAQDYTSKHNNGEYGWHPASILYDQLGSFIPIDFAFSADPGTLGQPLLDTEKYKQSGYWLINVTEMIEDEAMVKALYLSSREEALDIKARLEAGDNLTALADQYTQYSPSKEGHGDLGLISPPANEGDTAITEVFDSYVFGPEVKIGEWSEPISEGVLWTRGGAWLVKVIDREDNRELSEEDRNTLINKEYDEWLTELWQETAEDVDKSGFTPETNKWASERAVQELQQN